MIKCIVIDDEPLAVKLLSSYVGNHDALHLTNAYHDPIKALHELDDNLPDLIFLDIQMPQLSGIQFLKILNNKVPVILTTAYTEHALESYNYKVIDYLIKPISFSRFDKAVEKYKAYNITKQVTVSNHSSQNEITNSIFVKSGYKNIRIELPNVKYLESKGDYLHIITATEVVKTLENLKDILDRLNGRFLRCHRSFIVNMDKVDYIENQRILIDKDYIPISRAYLDSVLNFVKNHNE